MVEGFSIEGGHVALIVAAASLFFEVSKIKVNPITFVLRWAGKRMFEPFEIRLDAVEKKIDENEIDRIRWEILEFANTCRKGERHTKDEFTHIIAQKGVRTISWTGYVTSPRLRLYSIGLKYPNDFFILDSLYQTRYLFNISIKSEMLIPVQSVL